MVMGIADGKLWLQSGFRGQSKPIITTEWHIGTSACWVRGPMITQSYFRLDLAFTGIRSAGWEIAVGLQVLVYFPPFDLLPQAALISHSDLLQNTARGWVSGVVTAETRFNPRSSKAYPMTKPLAD